MDTTNPAPCAVTAHARIVALREADGRCPGCGQTHAEPVDTNTGTIALKSTASGIEVLFRGHTLDVIADGATLVRRADAVLRGLDIFRTTGYDSDGVNLVAVGTQVVPAEEPAPSHVSGAVITACPRCGHPACFGGC